MNKIGVINGFGGYVVLIFLEDLGIVVLVNCNYLNEVWVWVMYDLI